jgi:hypothetical protein
MTFKETVFLGILIILSGCTTVTKKTKDALTTENGQPVYIDKPFIQDFSVKYYLQDNQPEKKLLAISADRDNHIRILSEKGILVPDNGSLFYSGKLIPDLAYQPMLHKKIAAILT